MTTYLFTTPVVEEGPTGRHRLFYFFRLNQGITVVRNGLSFSTGRFFSQDELEEYDEYYLGGHEHPGITEEIKTAMIAANIGVTEANFVAE